MKTHKKGRSNSQGLLAQMEQIYQRYQVETDASQTWHKKEFS